MLTYFYYIYEGGDMVLYSVSQIMTTTKLVKLCHIRYGKGQKEKLGKTTVKVLHFVLVNQEGSH